MTDAKGLSEELRVGRFDPETDQWPVFIYIGEHCYGTMADFYSEKEAHAYVKLRADYAGLAERLKVCEESLERWKRRKDLWERAYRGYDDPEEEREKRGLAETARAEVVKAVSEGVSLTMKLQVAEQSNERLRAAVERVVDIAKTPLLPIQEAYHLMRDEAQAALTKTQHDNLNIEGRSVLDWAMQCKLLEQEVAELKAELARMKADPEILIRHQANEAQCALEETQKSKS